MKHEDIIDFDWEYTQSEPENQTRLVEVAGSIFQDGVEEESWFLTGAL